jgi:hypothetical protein
MNNQHILALVEAIYRAYLNAIHVFAFYATFDNDVGHPKFLRASGCVAHAPGSGNTLRIQNLAQSAGVVRRSAALRKVQDFEQPHRMIHCNCDNIAGTDRAARGMDALAIDPNMARLGERSCP